MCAGEIFEEKKAFVWSSVPLVGNCLVLSVSMFLPSQKPSLTPEATHKTYIEVNLLAEMIPYLVRYIFK